MKQWWTVQAGRINAMSLRERGFLFLSFIFVVLALADVLWLSPAQVAHKQVTQRHAAQGVELVRLRAELTAVAQPVDANKAARNELAAADAQLQATMQDIAKLVPGTNGGPALEQVLVQFLRRQSGLTLLGTTTLAPEPSAAVVSGSPQVALVPGMTRRGLELRVAGPYGELTRYVKTLEAALPTLRWGPLRIKRDKDLSELTLQVYVVGIQP